MRKVDYGKRFQNTRVKFKLQKFLSRYSFTCLQKKYHRLQVSKRINT